MTDHEPSVAQDLAVTSAAVAGATLCRVWTLGPGDLCASCSMAPECDDRRECLHLAASVGLTRRLDGPFRRFPLGAREVGRVARTLEPLVLADGLAAAGVAEPAWLALHGIAGFAAFPIASSGKCLGVLALFSKQPIGDENRRAIEALVRLAAAALSALAPATPSHAPRSISVTHEMSSSLADVQRRAILAALESTGGRLSGPGGAAEILGMKPTTLESRIRRLGVRKPPRLKLR